MNNLALDWLLPLVVASVAFGVLRSFMDASSADVYFSHDQCLLGEICKSFCCISFVRFGLSMILLRYVFRLSLLLVWLTWVNSG